MPTRIFLLFLLNLTLLTSLQAKDNPLWINCNFTKDGWGLKTIAVLSISGRDFSQPFETKWLVLDSGIEKLSTASAITLPDSELKFSLLLDKKVFPGFDVM